ncbi:MAG: nuclease-related domain-containing protein, partial [Acidimicrobiales bacterium]
VVNDVEFPGFNVDHVVVGPTGVWVIETKSYQGTFRDSGDELSVDGHPVHRDPRAQAKAGAAAISGFLHRETGMRWWVEPLVCLPNATVEGGGAREACVVGGGQLLGRIRLAPIRLDGKHRDLIVGALGRRKGHALQRVA